MTEETPVGIRRDATGVHGLGLLEDGRTTRVVVTEHELVADGEPTLADLGEALRFVFGTDFGVHSPTWISRFTDAARQAAAYRVGRVLLAGDAAHTHHPAGGQGIGLGVQDAVNLGWKLAQVVQGVSTDDLLDTYHEERHPAGARTLGYTMAQSLLQKPDARIDALCAILDDTLAFDGPRRAVGGLISGLDVVYDLGDGHPLLGRRMPDLDVVTTDGPRRVYELLHDARPLLLDLGGSGGLDARVDRSGPARRGDVRRRVGPPGRRNRHRSDRRPGAARRPRRVGGRGHVRRADRRPRRGGSARARASPYGDGSTQNSLPSGSARTVHATSPWPMSARVAPRAINRSTSWRWVAACAGDEVVVQSRLPGLGSHGWTTPRDLRAALGRLDRGLLVLVPDEGPAQRLAPEVSDGLGAVAGHFPHEPAAGQEAVARLDDAELVALGVGQHHVLLLGQLPDVKVVRAESERLRHRRRLVLEGGAGQVEVHRVQAGLGLRAGDEPQPEAGVGGRQQLDAVAVVVAQLAGEELAPEARDAPRVAGVEAERVELGGHAVPLGRRRTRDPR